ncbi:MAG: isoleucine--tRNA ligase [Bacteroidetes bacterium]|nr:isoleucine--tRNA ligase [Bacteroidota bacterium]
MKYREYKELDFAQVASEILDFWKKEKIFDHSVSNREGRETFTFYEGPPSANGTPGIHHVMARTVKDIFCRFKTLQGYQVKRKGGWDTHGLPVELQVEKELGITKDDIGKKISIEDYNRRCRETVMKYKDQWDDLTEKMGYWVDLQHPYITYNNEYIETLWWILKQFHGKGLLYKGYTIQPYSPSDGTGLSSHELNQPGCYRDVKDTSIVAQFKVKRDERSQLLFQGIDNDNVYILAWTTTPWTLPSNTALAVNQNISYTRIGVHNKYTGSTDYVILAKDLVDKYIQRASKPGEPSLKPGNRALAIESGEKDFKGSDLVGIEYEQLIPYVKPLYDADKAFRVIHGDFVTTEDGTGVVHISPTFGADDFRAAKQNGIPPLTVRDEDGNEVPTVDRKGKFVKEIGARLKEAVAKYGIKTHKPFSENDFYVKNYTDEDESLPDYKNTDVILSIILKEENKAFKVEKYEHTYPHSWRTDKPVLYYPLDAWFIRTTALKDRMAELNRTINWKPESTGTGRFGNWLENLVDWNLSRSRYWGTPLPIWRTRDGKEEICIGSLSELKAEIEKAAKAGVKNTFNVDGPSLDLHRPYVDSIVLISPTGQQMFREPDLIDVWFDSGAMPYAQWGLNAEKLKDGHPQPFGQGWEGAFPADYISEGVDQTRGWFFTLHAIASLLFDSVAFKNVISTGLVLDKDGNKMSKRKGNVINPYTTMEKYGADVVRWYMIENAPPWDNLKFDMNGLVETQRRFFGTLMNTYSFFSLYANIDGFVKDEMNNVPYDKMTILDRWIISKLQTLIIEVTEAYNDYEPTRAARAIQSFVDDHLSNWYVRLNRKRFWQPGNRGELQDDKRAAYETLYECLMVVSQLMSPIAPFYAEFLYRNLTDNIRDIAKKLNTPLRHESVHHTDLVLPEKNKVDAELERSMEYAQKICSLVHSIRKNNKIKVRTPLNKVMIPVLDEDFAGRVRAVEDIIKAEVNLKAVEYIDDTSGLLVKKAKPNFPKLGKQYGSRMKEVSSVILSMTREEIGTLEKKGILNKGGFELVVEDVILSSEDIPGWAVASEGVVTAALDITITDNLRKEGLARDFVNRVQNLRKDMGLQVLDKISIEVGKDALQNGQAEMMEGAFAAFNDYIRTETQATSLDIKDRLMDGTEVDMDEFVLKVKITLKKQQ